MDNKTQERIKADAKKKYPRVTAVAMANRNGYIAGATAENAQNESVRLQLEAQDDNVEILLQQHNDLMQRAQAVIDKLEQVELVHKQYHNLNGNNPAANHLFNLVREALLQWKSGNGKEIGNE